MYLLMMFIRDELGPIGFSLVHFGIPMTLETMMKTIRKRLTVCSILHITFLYQI